MYLRFVRLLDLFLNLLSSPSNLFILLSIPPVSLEIGGQFSTKHQGMDMLRLNGLALGREW
jgi:hypothetical protein